MKFKECDELRTRLGNCISAAIAEGLRQGLEDGIEHGLKKTRLEDVEAYDLEAKERYTEAVIRLGNVSFPLLDSLEAYKDSPLEFLMSQLVLEEDRLPGSTEITFGPPVAEERILPDSLLKRLTSHPCAVATYKEIKNKKYGKEFDFSFTVPRMIPLRTPESAACSEGGVDTSPSAPFTGPKGDDEAQRDLEYTDNELFDTSILDQPENPSVEKSQDKPSSST